MLSNSWSKAKYIKDIITYYLESFSEKWNVLTRIISNKIRKGWVVAARRMLPYQAPKERVSS